MTKRAAIKGRWQHTGALATLAVLLTAAGLVAARVAVAAPRQPETGELTGVVKSNSDTPIFGSWLSGPSESPGQVVTLLPHSEYRSLFAANTPGEDPSGDWYLAATTDWQVPASRLSERRGAVGSLVDASDGRFRIRWDGSPVVLCLGRGSGEVVLIRGCFPVPGEPPESVVVHVGVIGMGVSQRQGWL